MLEKFFWDKTGPEFLPAYLELAFIYSLLLSQPKKGNQLLEKAEKMNPSVKIGDLAFVYLKAKVLMDLGRYEETRSYLFKLDELLNNEASMISREEFAAQRKRYDWLHMNFYLRLGEYQKSLSYIEKIETDSKQEIFLLGFWKTLNYYCLGRQEETSEFFVDLFECWKSLAVDEKEFVERNIVNNEEMPQLLDNEVTNKSLKQMLENALDQISKSGVMTRDLIPLLLQTVAQCYYNQREYGECAQALESLMVHSQSIKIRELNEIFYIITFGSNKIDARVADLWKALVDTKVEDINGQEKIRIASLWIQSSLKLQEYHRLSCFLTTKGFERCETILISQNSPQAKPLLGHTRLYLGLVAMENGFLLESKEYLTQSIQAFEGCKDQQIYLTLAYLSLAKCYKYLFEDKNSEICQMKANELLKENNMKTNPKDKERWTWLSKF